MPRATVPGNAAAVTRGFRDTMVRDARRLRAADREPLRAYVNAGPGPASCRSHAAMQCPSLLREASWSIVSERHVDTPAVGYAACTRDNLAALDRAVDGYRSRWR